MSRLDEDRKKIDVIDRQIAELFEKRFEVVRDVIEYKIENRLPILNSGREAEITKKNTALINDEDIREYFKVASSVKGISEADSGRTVKQKTDGSFRLFFCFVLDLKLT